MKKLKKITEQEAANRAAQKLEGKALNALSRFNFGSAFAMWQHAQEVRAGKSKIVKKAKVKKAKVKVAA